MFFNKPHPKTRPRRGFALVITISLMVLLALLAVGLLSLSTVSLRAAGSEELMRTARQNARLGMQIALGELQKNVGPDQRITAPSSVLGEETPQPHLTGVWNGWKWDGQGTAPDYDERKQSDFRRWMVSNPDAAAVESQDFARAEASGESLLLVGGRELEKDRVRAPRVGIDDGGAGRQGFAWAVFDEATKLPTALPEDEPEDAADAIAAMSAAPRPGYEAPEERQWQSLAEAGDERLKLVSAQSTAFLNLAEADRSFHDLTTRSAAPLADAAEGGLALDLSRLFDDPNELPDEFSSRYLYSDADTPLASAPSRFRGANPLPSPDPSWRLLRSHYRLFDQLGGGQSPTLSSTRDRRPAAGTPANRAESSNFFHEQQIAPVIAKAQFVFSLSFGYHGSLASAAAPNNSSLPPGRRDEYVTWFVVDPVITLWNPYNVPLRFTGGRIDLYRVPLAFRLYKNGRLINREFTHFANTFVSGDFNQRSNTFYKLKLLPPDREREIVMEPGEHLVFTAHNHVKHYLHQYNEEGLELRPGFNPPAANSSHPEVGGTSSMNVCVSSNGTPSGTDYGKTVRTVAVKPGDRMQVEVEPMRASVDRLEETGGEEVSGFLKYYIGDPERNPQLVGGIELNLGEEEQELLPTYSPRDLPTFVVSSDIPRGVKADDYQGRNPPVAVRFKEPFLISSFQLKTERDSIFPTAGWLHNSPVNLYASAGLDQEEPWSMHQYEIQWEPMTDWPPASPTIEISADGNRGYGGSGIYAQSGVEFATHSSIPLAPALSLAQFRHAPLNAGGQLPLSSQVLANSFAHPLLPADRAIEENGGRTYFDHSLLANNALFDRTFLSGLATPGGPAAGTSDPDEMLTRFLDSGDPLPNPRFIAHPGGLGTEEIIEEITGDEGYRRAAAHLMIDSPFNVNSTRVDVWEAMLASAFGRELPVMRGGSLETEENELLPVARHLGSPGERLEDAGTPPEQDLAL